MTQLEGTILCDRPYFKLQNVERAVACAKENGILPEELRFSFYPRYDFSGNPWELCWTGPK